MARMGAGVRMQNVLQFLQGTGAGASERLRNRQRHRANRPLGCPGNTGGEAGGRARQQWRVARVVGVNCALRAERGRMDSERRAHVECFCHLSAAVVR